MKVLGFAKNVAALLIGAAIALPVGMRLAGGSSARPPAAVPADVTGFRQPYSPIVLRDPHFLAEQRKAIETLEKRCREAREFCAEAAGARRWLAEHR